MKSGPARLTQDDAPHQEINASASDALECVLVRSDGEANLDIEPVETVRWVDPIRRRSGGPKKTAGP